MIQNDGGVIVSRINNLFNINRFIHSKEEGVEHFWIVQGLYLRKIDVRSLTLIQEMRLDSAPQHNLAAYEQDPFTLWILIDDKYLHLNEKFIAQLPFSLITEAIKIVYVDSFILILERVNQCHLIEVNEYYNIVNHQVISVQDSDIKNF